MSPPVHLTPQQHRALSFCALGLTDAEIAARMGLSRRTVKFHLARSMQAFDVHSRTAAACRALAWGLLPEVFSVLVAQRALEVEGVEAVTDDHAARSHGESSAAEQGAAGRWTRSASPQQQGTDDARPEGSSAQA